MTALIPGLTVLIGWILALVGVSAVGSIPGDTLADSAMRWMLFLPGGIMFIVSAFMHTVLARKTAAQIGWKTNGFQYEIGFVSLGLGIAGIVAANGSAASWWPIAIAQGTFLALCTVQHVVDMRRQRNFAPGNTFILIYDIALPLSYLGLALALR